MPTPLPSRPGTVRSIGGFTVVDLVIVLILGILATIAAVGYTQVTDHATTSASAAQPRQLAETVPAAAPSDSAPLLDGALATSALEEPHGMQINDPLAAAAPWAPLSTAGTSDDAALADSTPAPAGEPTPADEPARARTAFGSMWVWDNSLTPDQDNRGTGYAAADPQTLVAFARQNNLSQVHIAAPWVSDEGPIAAWMDETTTALHDAGFEVGVLGGDPGWLDDPSLAVTWTLDAISTRPVDYVELSLEPWTLPSWNTDRVGTVERWEATMDAVKAALPTGVKLALDAPYWLATTPAPDGGTLFDAVLERADALSIVTFVDHAADFDGIIALSAPARTAAGAAGIPYMVGLETDTPAVAGGAAFTFYDDGGDALVREAELVGEALAGDPLYGGVDVEHYRAWRSLLGMS
ncbi:hypothetical protein SAMN05216410_2603 [Sanguibacter gelidistatuariae]|uniref:Uncharacterized protein n=1 Tax=Sanguibacter gelidistatuariae TaxID=1814289 RepID=A0A1G6QR76_9MICO|nr:hypothetical protein [Sanguibacter gelidistatuariae]SDC94197.1 hypothetical protein SAMN05216410_2603 [Sanguibacter gelidistatuariae]